MELSRLKWQSKKHSIGGVSLKDVRDIPEIAQMMDAIEDVQEGQSLRCSVIDCYWNMWSPRERWNNEESMQCVSESLSEFKMTPDSKECKGHWSYKEACGHEKALK